ncbi:unnamed protein product [Amoebophrya sp. A120]|nr:unnamed protein product [Amoebophrya sp. A120]|eukprot:GSA120T00020041001.1
MGAKEETILLLKEIFGEHEILFPASLTALGKEIAGAFQDELSTLASVVSSFTNVRPPSISLWSCCRAPSCFPSCRLPSTNDFIHFAHQLYLVFTSYLPSILALTIVDLFKFCADALLLVASIVSIQTTLELSDLDLDLVIFHDFSVTAKVMQLLGALEDTMVPIIGWATRQLFSHFDFLFTEFNLGVGDIMGTRSNCTLAIVLFAAGVLTGSTLLLCQVVGGDWLGLLVGGRAKILITKKDLTQAKCKARGAGEIDSQDEVYAPSACSLVSIKALAATSILKFLPLLFKGISAGIFLALQVTLILANQYTCYLFVLLIQGYEVDPADPVHQPGTACEELGNAFPEIGGELQIEDTAVITGMSTTEMLLSATLSVAFMLVAVFSLFSGFVLLQKPLCFCSQQVVNLVYYRDDEVGLQEGQGGKKNRQKDRGAVYATSTDVVDSATLVDESSLPAVVEPESPPSPKTPYNKNQNLVPISVTLRTGLDPASNLRNRPGQISAGPQAVAGIWDKTVRACFCVEERCVAYAKSMGFEDIFALKKHKKEFHAYKLEMQEATGKALSGLFLLFPFGALITKTVEYVNTPDLDWGHRREVKVVADAKKKTTEQGDEQRTSSAIPSVENVEVEQAKDDESRTAKITVTEDTEGRDEVDINNNKNTSSTNNSDPDEDVEKNPTTHHLRHTWFFPTFWRARR